MCMAYFKEHEGLGNEVIGQEDDALKSRGHILFHGHHGRF